jgi:hypothetical protein
MTSLWQPFELSPVFLDSTTWPSVGGFSWPLPRWDVGENGSHQSLVPSLEAVSRVLGVDVMSNLHFSLQDWLNSMSKSLLVWVCASASWLALHYSNYYRLSTFGRTQQQQFTPRPPVSNFLLISCQFITALLVKPTVVHIMLTAGLSFQRLFVTVLCPFAIRIVVGSHVPLSVLIFFF